MPGRSPVGPRESGGRGIHSRAVHPPIPAPQPGTPVSPPLDLSTIYSFDSTEEFARATKARAGQGYVYTRWGNPTLDAFEAAVADLEGTEDAEAFSSGMAAISTVLLALCSAGDRIAAVRQLYGNSYSLLAERLPRYGIETAFFDVDEHDGLEAALHGAKLLYCETIGNPRVQVADLPRLAAAADEAGIPLIVDNTFASPVLCRPAEHGARIVIHSATKFLGGHHDLLGGIACGDAAALAPVKDLARDLGGTLAPFNAWLCWRGIATLPLRVERASDSALVVAKALREHPDVRAVYYPALAGDASEHLADTLLGGRGGAIIGFEVDGGRERAARLQDRLRMVKRAASLGGSHSLIVHAASITHTQLSPEELVRAGISEGFCRLSVGLEDPADIIEDLEAALKESI